MDCTRVLYPGYACFKTRLDTFASWSALLRPEGWDLAHAGFVYTNFGDKVTCFACGIVLCGWKREDDPWLEHHRHARDCVYLNMVGGVRLWNKPRESSGALESRINLQENRNTSTSNSVENMDTC